VLKHAYFKTYLITNNLSIIFAEDQLAFTVTFGLKSIDVIEDYYLVITPK